MTADEQVPGGSQDRRLEDRLHAMHERELLDFIRETVAQLDSLSDRLEVYVAHKQGAPGAGDSRTATSDQ